MKKMNQTSVAEFILLGLTEVPELQVPLFFLIILVYTITVVCNISLSLIIIMVSQLHKPMYFFLCNLSISDFGCSSVIAPKMLKDLLFKKKSIKLAGCAAQAFFSQMFVDFGTYMLSAMSYDRYAAICHPLLYSLIMSRSMCIMLASGVYVSGIITAAGFTGCAFHASFYGSNVIDHFFCDAPALFWLSSSNTINAKIVFFVMSFFFGLGSFSITVTSYIYIVSAILKIKSTAGRRKTFSTCGSHLTCLSLLYVTAFFNFLSLPGSGSTNLNKIMSVLYTVVIPMLNPWIYSLRNSEMKGVLLTIMHKKCYFCYMTN